MANCIYVGNAPAIAQVETLTFGGTWEATDLVIITFGTKIWSMAAGSTTIATITAAVEAAWNALAATDYPEFAEITADSTATTVTLTCDTKGRAIVPVATTTEANGDVADMQTLSQSTTTANSGPSDWNNAMNWSGGAVPVDTDSVYFDGAVCNVDVKYGLNQTGIQLAAMYFRNGWSGDLGLPERNTDGTEYDEYRLTSLTADITTIDCHSNSGRIKINGQAVQTAAAIHATGNSSESEVPAFQWFGTHASNTFTINGGSVGIAVRATQAATVLTLRQSGGVCVCGAGSTLTTVLKTAGTLTIEVATTAITNDAGDVTINGTGAHAAITNSGGTIKYNSSGTITAYTGNKTGAIDFDGRNVARTLTDATFNDAASMKDTNRTVTQTNVMVVYGTLGDRFKGRRSYSLKLT